MLVEDWCGDAVNTVPVLARLAEAVPGLDLPVPGAGRLMDLDLSADAGHPGAAGGACAPRPCRRGVGPREQALEKSACYGEIRRWYARDRGRTTLDEVIGLMEQTVLQAA